ncbi:hypothetical protein DXB59_00175 [Ruminococcus sp. OM05-10BH]|nr:hypothetical protein DXB59_00175 [Ruminococcus sp. OM05-10BH]
MLLSRDSTASITGRTEQHLTCRKMWICSVSAKRWKRSWKMQTGLKMW